MTLEIGHLVKNVLHFKNVEQKSFCRFDEIVIHCVFLVFLPATYVDVPLKCKGLFARQQVALFE